MSESLSNWPVMQPDPSETLAAIEQALAVLIRYRAQIKITNAGLDHTHVEVQLTHERLAGFSLMLRDDDPMQYQVINLVSSLVALEREVGS